MHSRIVCIVCAVWMYNINILMFAPSEFLFMNIRVLCAVDDVVCFRLVVATPSIRHYNYLLLHAVYY